MPTKKKTEKPYVVTTSHRDVLYGYGEGSGDGYGEGNGSGNGSGDGK